MLTMTTIFILLLLLGIYYLSRKIWPWRLNPISIFILAWTPALVFTTVSYEFIHPVYAYLNNGVDLETYLLIFVAFIAFSIGSIVACFRVSGRAGQGVNSAAVALSDDRKLFHLFLIGFLIFIYVFGKSGLSNQMELEPEEIYESRMALNVGPIGLFVIFMDVTSIVYAAKFMETMRKLYLLPLIITIISYSATLQKSRVLFIIFSVIFIFLLYPRESKDLLFGNFNRRFLSIATVFLFGALFFLMNAMRGIGLVSYTNFEFPIFEQFFIYSGGTAIINLSCAIQGLIDIGEPTYGLVLARPILWHFIDRDLISPTKYFEGINTATYLIYPWSDFRWFGMVFTPFITGIIVTIFLRNSKYPSIINLVLGAIGFTSVLMSPITDVIFDQTTLIIIIIAIIVSIYARKRSKINSVGTHIESV